MCERDIYQYRFIVSVSAFLLLPNNLWKGSYKIRGQNSVATVSPSVYLASKTITTGKGETSRSLVDFGASFFKF